MPKIHLAISVYSCSSPARLAFLSLVRSFTPPTATSEGELVPYLPNVRSIEVKSRTEENGLIYLVNEWHGGGEIPVWASAFLSEAMLSWTDYATWNDGELTTQWRIETHSFTEAVYCAGKNRFLEESSGTRIESLGELKIEPKKLTGVPPFLARKVGKVVEDFLVQKIEPNLLQVSEGVRLYLEQTQKDLA